MYDWIASWAQNVFFGFFLPGDSTVSQEGFDSAVRDLEAFMDAFRFVFPRRSYPEACRFCAYIPGVPGMANLTHPVSPPNALLDAMYPPKRPAPGNVSYDQRQFLAYASLFLNNPSLSDWETLRTLSWETDPEQPIWHPELHFVRWEQMIRESLPILRGHFRTNLFPASNRSTTIDELIQRADDLCNDIGRVRQSPAATRESEGATPPAMAAEKSTVQLNSNVGITEQPPNVATPSIVSTAMAAVGKESNQNSQFIPLTGWHEILAALNEPHGKVVVWKQGQAIKEKIRKLNDAHDGPINFPKIKGAQPNVSKSALMTWWAGLEENFAARTEESEANAKSERLTVSESHQYGATGTVVPGISGSVKPTRANREKDKEGER